MYEGLPLTSALLVPRASALVFLYTDERTVLQWLRALKFMVDVGVADASARSGQLTASLLSGLRADGFSARIREASLRISTLL